MARIMLVGPDLVAANAVDAGPGYLEPAGFVGVASDTAKIGDIFDPVTGTFSAPVVPVEVLRPRLVAAVEAKKEAILAQGVSYGGKRISLSDASRADLGGMALTALMVSLGVLPEWPENYALGWIATDNTRIPMATPIDGIQLAYAAAGFYSAVVQHGRTSKNAVLSAPDPQAAYNAISWSAFGG